MDWFLYDNGPRHERVKNTEKTRNVQHVIFIFSAFKSNVTKTSPVCLLDFKEPLFVVYNIN